LYPFHLFCLLPQASLAENLAAAASQMAPHDK
jgi:hypothetical protein